MTSDQRPLLLFNAAFSLLSGALFVAAPTTVAGWLGVDANTVIRLVGVVLVTHAILIVVLMQRMPLRQVVLLNLFAIAPYPLLMVLLSIGFVGRPLGHALALGDGAIIGAIAVAHAAGLRNTSASHQALPA